MYLSRTMATWLVFCTAQIPSETIEAFQTQSTSHKSAPLTPWILQQTPSEGVHGPELSNPPPSFTTGFKDASPSTIQTFIKENLEDRHEFPDFIGAIAWDEFVILDERSVEDNTCLVYHRLSRMPEGSDGVEWDKEKLIHEWKGWRVKFLVAWALVAGLSMADDVVFSIWEDEKDAYWDEHGHTTLQRDVVSDDLVPGNTTRGDGIALGKMYDSLPLMGKILLRQEISIQRPRTARVLKVCAMAFDHTLMILEADESYFSNLASASILGLTKPVHATSYEAWYDIKNEESGKDNNICPLRGGRWRKWEKYVFGYEGGLFPVVDKQEELSAAASLYPQLHRSTPPSHPVTVDYRGSDMDLRFIYKKRAGSKSTSSDSK
ncbi:hypothetical protein CJF31_00006197 [Rutstroemia sp. NJR-2017a BVV2]|nr:hypothetical protein CJF31_00006197 [Rutstroemia sp. NJR-2017a BVV2]